MSTLSFRNINKIYDNNVQAVFDFNLEIKDKEFIVFVGPSGCGKSTTLRMVAGLEEITDGELYIDNELVNEVHPKDRDIAMVFQSYALYPHMSVYENMAFGLKIRHMSREEIDQRIKAAAEILGLQPYLKRKPKELSGGQRQRVALGRAIVREPKVFLMDEPLSNLDAKLRVQMRTEITKIHQKVGATTIYVTHDQTEAMTMADRIVVMKDGYVQQIGTPKEIYNKPANVFVATFIGAPSMNILDVEFNKDTITLPNKLTLKINNNQVEELKKSLKSEIDSIRFQIAKLEEENTLLKKPAEEQTDKMYKTKSFKKRISDILKLNEESLSSLNERLVTLKKQLDEMRFQAILGVRPEDIVSEQSSKLIKDKSALFPLFVNQAELLGNEYYIYSNINNKKVIAKISANEDVKVKEERKFAINLKNIHLFDKISEKRYF